MQSALTDPEVKYNFSGHESFPFRFGWLVKGVQRSLEDNRVFNREDAPIILGVGKNMVRSIKYWCSAMGLITVPQAGTVCVTDMGKLLFAKDGLDPYMEDIGTLWLLHWLMVRSFEYTSTWYLAFTRFGHVTFTRKQLVEYLLKSARDESPRTRVTESSMSRDVDVFVRTYVSNTGNRSSALLEESFDCPLVELGLLEESPTGVLSFVIGSHPSLPDMILAFALADYWERVHPQQKTLSFEQTIYIDSAPGAAFKLTENALVERFERLPEWTGLRFDETAGRRMLIRLNNDADKPSVWPLRILRHYYETEGET
ncbi:MAG TPA: DUF4007 family protein [Firmicutes bacterium]|nr:DUF4007 family protein [Bacillota bacterium]